MQLDGSGEGGSQVALCIVRRRAGGGGSLLVRLIIKQGVYALSSRVPYVLRANLFPMAGLPQIDVKMSAPVPQGRPLYHKN